MLTSGHSQLRLWHSQLSISSFVGAQLITLNKTPLGSGPLQSTAGHLPVSFKLWGKLNLRRKASAGSRSLEGQAVIEQGRRVATLGFEVVVQHLCAGRTCRVGKALPICAEGLKLVGLLQQHL